ncbi:MAG: hypothetical protein M3Z29_15515 [Pseudomonadota bacterium]|nr:hypothetical protein [Pseudomonadota bacterium]
MSEQWLMPSDTMRLDEPGLTHPYVYDAVQWKLRCGKRLLELDDELQAEAVLHCLDDLALSPRWRLMAPEEAAEALYSVPRPRE